MTRISDLQTITEQYANATAKEYGTSAKWVSVDGIQEYLKQHHPTRKLSYQVKDAIFHWGAPSPKQDIMFKQRLENRGSERPTTTIRRSEKKSDTFSWSITEGIKLSQSVTVKAGINIEAIQLGIEATTSFEFNFSSTQGKSKTVERTWEVDQIIPQAPFSQTEIEWLLDRNVADGQFTAQVIVSGWVAIWFKDKIDLNHTGGKDLHWLWFPSAASVVRKMKPPGFTVYPSGVIFNATGSIQADVGLESRLMLREKPLPESLRRELAEGVATVSVAKVSATTVEYVLSPDGKALQEMHDAAEDS